ncbi:MAG: GNAT family N-acetyltransferase [Daejeonella sp.]
MKENEFIICTATKEHIIYSDQICNEMGESAKARGTGIAKRTSEYLSAKILEGKAIIALHYDGSWAGFCYIETWSHGAFVANSGLIVNPPYRNKGLAKKIKKAVFNLSREKYPEAKIFGLTTGLPVMKINSELGYEPVTYSELSQDEEFWKGCQSCVNYEILKSKERKNCMCTAMLWDPVEKAKEIEEKMNKLTHKSSLLERIGNKLKRSAKAILPFLIFLPKIFND